jgi:type IX secretion system PorP/SprF family membrane protein
MMTKFSSLFFIGVGFFLAIPNVVLGQNEPQFTQYMFNRQLLSPAYAGSNKGLELAGVVRIQYVGLANTISTTQGFTASSSVDALHGGIGVNVTNDLIGLQRSTSMQFSYAYQKRFSRFSLGIAAAVGFINVNIDGSRIITPDGDYVSTINHRDPQLPTSNTNSFSPDFSAGIYLGNEKYFALAGVNHLYTSLTIKGQATRFFYNTDRYLQLGGGYNFRLGKNVKLQPSLLLKTNFQKIQVDLSLLLTIHDNIMTGFAFRGYSAKTIDAFSVFIGGQLKGIKIIYSYDTNISFLKSFNSGTHEISLSYFMPYKSSTLKGVYYHNARFL